MSTTPPPPTADVRPPVTERRHAIAAKIVVSGIAAALLYLDLRGKADVDAPALGLIALVVLPWLSAILENAELPGGWKVKFREVAAEQQRLGTEVQWLKFLMTNFLTQYELEHLRKFAAEGPFWFEYSSDTKSYFERELRRMLDLNLIARLPNKGIRGLLYDREGVVSTAGKDVKDVKQYLHITAQGRQYLDMRGQLSVPQARSDQTA